MIRRSIIVCTLLSSGVAEAEPPSTPPFSVSMSDCAREVLDEPAVVNGLRVELGSDVIAKRVSTGYSITIDCAGPGADFVVSTRRPQAAEPTRTTIHLEDVPASARSRTFSLAVAE